MRKQYVYHNILLLNCQVALYTFIHRHTTQNPDHVGIICGLQGVAERSPVDLRRIELLVSSMPWKRDNRYATGPCEFSIFNFQFSMNGVYKIIIEMSTKRVRAGCLCWRPGSSVDPHRADVSQPGGLS